MIAPSNPAARARRQTSRPSMSGSPRSRMTTSGALDRLSSAFWPLSTQETSYPSRSSVRTRGNAMSSSSSTTRTRCAMRQSIGPPRLSGGQPSRFGSAFPDEFWLDHGSGTSSTPELTGQEHRQGTRAEQHQEPEPGVGDEQVGVPDPGQREDDLGDLR